MLAALKEGLDGGQAALFSQGRVRGPPHGRHHPTPHLPLNPLTPTLPAPLPAAACHPPMESLSPGHHRGPRVPRVGTRAELRGQSHYPALIWGVSGINHHRPHSPPHAYLNRAPCQACLRQFPHVNNTSISPMQQIRHNWPPPGPYFLLLIMIRCGILSSLMPFRRLQRFLFNYEIVRF